MTRLQTESFRTEGEGSGSRNLTVVARNSTDGFYYRGYITNTVQPDEDSHRVRFYNLLPQNVPVHHVVNFGGAVPWPDLKVGNYVLAEVRCRTSGLECFMPGRVLSIPFGTTYDQRFYTIKLYNGRLTNKRRRYIVKIGPEKYKDILDYMYNIRYRNPIRFTSETDLVRRRLLAREKYENSCRIRKSNSPRSASSSAASIARSTSSSAGSTRRHDRNGVIRLPTSNKRIQTENRNPSMTLIRQLGGSTPTLSMKSSTRDSFEKSSRSSRSLVTRTSSSRSSRTDSHSTDHHQRDSHSTDGCHSKGSRTSSRRTPVTQPLPEGKEVLARWADDGWYYFGVIVTEVENKYIVRDSTGHMETINRDDLLIDDENLFEAIQPYDYVVALHPRYVYSYAPATVTEVYHFGVNVIFYDKMERKLPWSEVYKISRAKYKESVDYIKAQEEKLCCHVVARDDVTGIYHLYMAESPDHLTQQVYLRMPNNTYRKQSAIHVFPMDAPVRYSDRDWRYVIAPLDQSSTVYLPAQVTCRQPVRLTFCNGQQTSEVKLGSCFYVSEDYYRNATSYFFNNYQTQ